MPNVNRLADLRHVRRADGRDHEDDHLSNHAHHVPARPWWNRVGQANSTRPTAILFYHSPKTGGNSVLQWLAASPSTGLLLPFTHAQNFFTLHSDLFPHFGPRRWPSGDGPMPHWRSTNVVVEFHAWSTRWWWEKLEPVLPSLRERYKQAGGRLLTLTTLREPVGHIVSMYRMWAPTKGVRETSGRIRGRPLRVNGSKVLLPLEEWLPYAGGLLTRELLPPQPNPFRPMSWWARRPFLCTAQQRERARTQLASFDLVGVLESASIARMLHALARCTGTALPKADVPHIEPEGVTKGGALWVASRASIKTTLANATHLLTLSAAAQCDAPLWELALKRNASVGHACL